MQLSLTGKVGLVTGAAQGIGRVIAETLGREGVRVAAVDVNLAGVKSVAEAIERAGGRAIALEGDVSKVASMEAVAGKVREAFGEALHVLVNNAAIMPATGVEGSSQADWDRTIGVDLSGVYAVTKAMLPLLKAGGESAGGASVINIASVHALASLPDRPAYAASKAGMLGLTRSLAFELGKFNITVNALSPGFISAPMLDAWIAEQPDPDAERKRILALHAVGRIGRPEDVADAVVFLASDRARYFTGSNLVLDGGLTAHLRH